MFSRGSWRALFAGVAVAGLSNLAAAERIDLLPFEGGPFAGLDVWLDLVDRGSEVDFRNDSTISSSIARIYIEDVPVASGLSGPVLGSDAGVAFTAGAAPARPPGSIDALFSPWAGSLFSAGAATPLPMEGVNPGERLTITFASTGSFSDMLTALRDGSGDFRVAAHIIDLPGGASAWASNVPAPGAIALFGFAGLAASRRRR